MSPQHPLDTIFCALWYGIANAGLVPQSPAIKNGPLPADGPGGESFSNSLLFLLISLIPTIISWKLGGGLRTTLFLALFTTIPTLFAYWTLVSTFSPRINDKAKYPGRPVEYYLSFKNGDARKKYKGYKKIPMETFSEMYFNSEVNFNGDALEVLEYRHDWASFGFTMGNFRFLLLNFFPELLLHSRSQGTLSQFPVVNAPVDWLPRFF